VKSRAISEASVALKKLRGTARALIAVGMLSVAPGLAVHAAEDKPETAAAHPAKAFGQTVKRDTKAAGATMKEGAHRVAVAARAVAHEVATAAKRGAAATRSAFRGEKPDTQAT
jgi:hypothetical protein